MDIERRARIKALWLVICLSILAVLFLVAAIYQYSELTKTKNILMLTQVELARVNGELQTTQANLSDTQLDVQRVQNELTQTQADFAATRTSLTTTQSELTTARQQIDYIQTAFSNIQTSYSRLTTGYGYVLNDPTYQVMKDFIAADKTNERKYDAESFNCEDFSASVTANAVKQKIRCGYVAIRYPDSLGHAIVVFNTTDKGLIYIEPQRDEEVNLQAGQHYYKCIVPAAGYYYTEPGYDDTIVRFTVIW